MIKTKQTLIKFLSLYLSMLYLTFPDHSLAQINVPYTSNKKDLFSVKFKNEIDLIRNWDMPELLYTDSKEVLAYKLLLPLIEGLPLISKKIKSIKSEKSSSGYAQYYNLCLYNFAWDTKEYVKKSMIMTLPVSIGRKEIEDNFDNIFASHFSNEYSEDNFSQVETDEGVKVEKGKGFLNQLYQMAQIAPERLARDCSILGAKTKSNPTPISSTLNSVPTAETPAPIIQTVQNRKPFLNFFRKHFLRHRRVGVAPTVPETQEVVTVQVEKKSTIQKIVNFFSRKNRMGSAVTAFKYECDSDSDDSDDSDDNEDF